MKGLIVVNAYIKNNSQISQAERIREEFLKAGVDITIAKNFNLAEIVDGKIKAQNYDFCVYLDKDRSAARLLGKSGIRLFNNAESIEVCDDKMLTHIMLADCGINMPDCIYAPLCYYPDAQVNEQFILNVAEKLNFPLVAKTCYGSLGAGVSLIKNMDELRAYEKNNMLTAHFYQKFINCGCGEDIRVIVIGGKYICSMKRRNDKDFRSNIELGGTGENYAADKNIIEICEKTARLLKLDYCGIDILRDVNGKIYVCEVNSNAFFAAAERCCFVNIAAIYVRHILNEMGNK
jgi:ribosomal protein S6--L-glutamate ligase/gamma-F420-2:alpha-L-glutamate ligase